MYFFPCDYAAFQRLTVTKWSMDGCSGLDLNGISGVRA